MYLVVFWTNTFPLYDMYAVFKSPFTVLRPSTLRVLHVSWLLLSPLFPFFNNTLRECVEEMLLWNVFTKYNKISFLVCGCEYECVSWSHACQAFFVYKSSVSGRVWEDWAQYKSVSLCMADQEHLFNAFCRYVAIYINLSLQRQVRGNKTQLSPLRLHFQHLLNNTRQYREKLLEKDSL